MLRLINSAQRWSFLFPALFFAATVATAPALGAAPTTPLDFPLGTATPSQVCGACHQAIHKEYSEGTGSDLRWTGMKGFPQSAAALTLPRGVSRSATAHAVAGIDPFPMEAMQVEQNGRRCIVCHFPEPLRFPEMSAAKIERPTPRAADQDAGITCASCHLTPEGSIRGPYGFSAPHRTVKDPAIQTSAACAYCHAEGERVVGKQTQTFLEWREDFSKPGLGPQHCQDCHMPRTTRKLAENYDLPARVSARHLWTGGHSRQRLDSALSLAIARPGPDAPQLTIHVTNVGAGHSVPTGSNRRAIYLTAEARGTDGKIVANAAWMFAPWFAGRPDDRALVEESRKGPNPVGAAAADAQGPHETIIRAGEDRVLVWEPGLAPGQYTVRAILTYDLNRYNDRAFTADQQTIGRADLAVRIGPQAR